MNITIRDETMSKSKAVFWLSLIVVALVWCSAGMGLFYSDSGQPGIVENIYGETIRLFGDGVYANDSIFKAATAKGSDLVMLIVSLGLLAATLKRDGGIRARLLHGGFLAPVLYYSATTAFGVTYNRMFLVYLLLFSAAFFAMIVSMVDLNETVHPANEDGKFTGTAIFTILAGCTTLVWLMSILPAAVTGEHLDIIEIYTTEPTFIIDLGIILPACIFGGVMLLRKKVIGYVISSIMLNFLAVMAVTVIGQAAMQLHYGVAASVRQVIGYVATFVVFGAIAAVVNANFLKNCWPKSK